MQIIRHGHWACGWIEYLMIDASDVAKVALGNEMEQELADYPILNEDDYSTRQMNAMFEYWTNCSLRERVDYCREAEVSIFAARYPQNLPERVEQNLQEMFY